MASTGSESVTRGSAPCLKCGVRLPDTAAYCYQCGQDREAARPSGVIGASASGGAGPSQAFCPACHRENFRDAHYCMFCGAGIVVAGWSRGDVPAVEEAGAPVERRAMFVVAGVGLLAVMIWGGWYAFNQWRASRGWALLESRAPDEALPYLQKAAEALPGNVLIRYRLGLAYLRTGQAGLAIEQLKQVWNDQPDMVEAGWTLGDAYLDAGMPSLAIPMYQKMLPTAPNARETWHRLAQAYKAAGEPDRAHEAYQQMERLKPSAP